ncbi:bifunctional lysylphosphatidylglycerol flippase/synthetase MprF [Roseomonas elaeocarpi]|uniref:Phosphatidylglycerol lysyltransferase n=1 Tax=Roseomonas elaeocarpi TaxID=907779 RepID=A0ABV6JUL3_9PROT
MEQLKGERQRRDSRPEEATTSGASLDAGTPAPVLPAPSVQVEEAAPFLPAPAVGEVLPSRWSLRLAAARPWLLGGLAGALVVLVLLSLRSLSSELDYDAVETAVSTTRWHVLAGAVLATVVSYSAMIGYDYTALRYVGASGAVPFRIVALASFTGFALSNTVGVGAFTGGAVRWRIYTAAGLKPSQVARIIGFITVAFGLGVVAVGIIGILAGGRWVGAWLGIPGFVLRWGAGAAVLALLGFLALCGLRRNVSLGQFTFRLPSARLTLAQFLISLADVGASATVLWLLLPNGAAPLSTFLPIYAIAVAVALVSHLPGGVGVFEAIILLAFRDAPVPLDQVAAGLLLYRAIYYAAPLALAVLLLVAPEARRGATVAGQSRAARAASRLAPRFLGALAFMAGAVLLLGGVAPSGDEGPGLLAPVLPAPLFEASHLLSSVGGFLLLLVAERLVHRLDAAWWASLLCAVGGIILSVARGGSLLAILALALLLIALLATRHRFDRRAALLAQPLRPGWLLAVGCVVAATVWLLFFANRDVPYSNELWWRFEFDEDAPRGLRVTLAAALGLGAFGLWSLTRTARSKPRLPSSEELRLAAEIANHHDRADAQLVRMGDKALLFSARQDAFVMYGQRGRSWIALFDPIGPRAQWSDLVWRFVELADAQGGRAAFYQVRADSLPFYLDAGFRPVKLGEAARVPLAQFDLKGRSRSNLRNAVNRAEREGMVFTVVPAADVPSILPELRQVSDAWLTSQAAREKAFSIGAFEASYVSAQPVAVVRDRDGRLLAFATLSETPGSKAEASVDLMRHVSDAPAGTMDFLFIRLLLRAKEQGYVHFDLGMAPLSGLAAHRLAPAWHKLGDMVFRRGSRFYNFKGLRAFKEKFDPVWEPRYLCASGGLDPWVVLADVAALQAGGLRGVVGK